MDKIIDKISAYNIFTNLFPGVIYCFLAEKFFEISLIQDNLLIAVFLYYFAGMVISRFSSVVLEPLLKLTKFIKLADYKKQISTLHITSWDQDHCSPGQLEQILEKFKPGKVEYPGYIPHTDSGKESLAIIKAYKAKRTTPTVISVTPEYIDSLDCASNYGYRNIIY